MFFESPESLNDINTIHHSPAMSNITAGNFPPRFPYMLNEIQRTMLYYLSHSTYLNCAIFARISGRDLMLKKKNIKCIESSSKGYWDSLRCLAARFQVLQRPRRIWYQKDIGNVIKEWKILHNTIVEKQRDDYGREKASLQYFEEACAMFTHGEVFHWETFSAA